MAEQISYLLDWKREVLLTQLLARWKVKDVGRELKKEEFEACKKRAEAMIAFDSKTGGIK